MSKVKSNPEFGEGWFIVPTKSGKFALVESKINVGAGSVEDLTDEQLKESNIEIFDNYDKAKHEMFTRAFPGLDFGSNP